MERSILVNFDWTGPAEKSGPLRKVDRLFGNFSGGTKPTFSFRAKFPEILVEWIAPQVDQVNQP